MGLVREICSAKENKNSSTKRYNLKVTTNTVRYEIARQGHFLDAFP